MIIARLRADVEPLAKEQQLEGDDVVEWAAQFQSGDYKPYDESLIHQIKLDLEMTQFHQDVGEVGANGLLVMFTAGEWCTRCADLHPHFAMTASVMARQDPPVRVASFNVGAVGSGVIAAT